MSGSSSWLAEVASGGAAILLLGFLLLAAALTWQELRCRCDFAGVLLCFQSLEHPSWSLSGASCFRRRRWRGRSWAAAATLRVWQICNGVSVATCCCEMVRQDRTVALRLLQCCGEWSETCNTGMCVAQVCIGKTQEKSCRRCGRLPPDTYAACPTLQQKSGTRHQARSQCRTRRNREHCMWRAASTAAAKRAATTPNTARGFSPRMRLLRHCWTGRQHRRPCYCSSAKRDLVTATSSALFGSRIGAGRAGGSFRLRLPPP